MRTVRVTAQLAAVTMVAAALLYAPRASAQSLDSSLFAHPTRQSITLGGAYRAYTIGGAKVNESTALVSYEVRATHVRFRLDGTGVRFAAAASTIQGTTPLGGKLDVIFSPGDTLTLEARSASQPERLDSLQAVAIGSAGTSTIDLESFAFGAPAMFGARGAKGVNLGDVMLSLRGGVDVEPKPSGRAAVYYRGTTVRGGATLSGVVGTANQLSAGFDVRKSFADSLGGKNLFPGGGDVTAKVALSALIENPWDELDDELDARVSIFYTRPFGDARNDQPNLLIPLGSTMGAYGSLTLPWGSVLLTPSLELLRESSSADATSGLVRATSTGTGWTTSLGLDAVIPVSSVVDITPQAGYVFGNVAATFDKSVVRRRGRPVSRSTSFSDRISGWFAGLELSLTF